MRAILTYHSIDRSRSTISIHPEIFEQHVEYLASGRVPVTSVEDLLAMAPGRDAVALTFDDGFENFVTDAWPLLNRHHLPVTVFVVSEHVGRDNRWGGSDEPGIPTLPLLTWPTLRELARTGVTLGAHSRTHVDLTQLDEVAMEDEVLGSVDRIEAETGQRTRLFAYPYGHVNTRVAGMVSHAVPWAFTTDFRAIEGSIDPALVPRLDAFYFREPERLRAWGTPTFKRYVQFRRTLRQVRSALVANRRSR